MQQRVAEARIGAERVIGAEPKSNTRNYALCRFFSYSFLSRLGLGFLFRLPRIGGI